MASAIDKLPSRFQNAASVRGLARSLDASKRQNQILKAEVKMPSIMGVMVPAQVGAFIAGGIDAKRPTILNGKVQTSSAIAIALLVGGQLKQQAWCLHAASAIFAVQSYAAGVKAGGGEVIVNAAANSADPGDDTAPST